MADNPKPFDRVRFLRDTTTRYHITEKGFGTGAYGHPPIEFRAGDVCSVRNVVDLDGHYAKVLSKGYVYVQLNEDKHRWLFPIGATVELVDPTEEDPLFPPIKKEETNGK